LAHWNAHGHVGVDVHGAGALSSEGYVFLYMISSAIKFYTGCVSYRIASKTTNVKPDEVQRGSLI
jgi:hypothetical protein